jgi:TPP-dependent indolepyruvate ferredoxin oxidoreductase alpha subunit
MILKVDPERCERCVACDLEVGCLGQVVARADPNEAPVIDQERCYGCGLCTMICRYGAVVEALPRVP